MYSALDSTFDGVSSVLLSDDSLGQEAVIVPGIGANCVSYKITHRGDRIDVLYPPPDAATLGERPSGFGIPILFPWPNRIEDSRFTFDGREVQLPVSDPSRPHELHGFVMGRPWDVVEKGASEDEGAFVRCRFRATDFPEIGAQYPFAFDATATYVLKDGALSLTVAGLNTGYDRVVTRRTGDAVSFWYYAGATLLAVDAANDPRGYMIGKRLIEAGKSPSPNVIADPETDMKALLKA